MKRFLLLGAGASAASDYHLPIMRGFFGNDADEFPELFSFLKFFYPQQALEDYNLEEVLAFLDRSRILQSSWGLSSIATDVEKLYLDVLGYINKRLAIPKGQRCVVHEKLFNILSKDDTIVTLNYDLIADQTLRHIEPKENDRLDQNCRIGKLEGLLREQSLWGGLQPPSLLPRELEWGFYLKLHGSLDWLYCPTMGCRNHVNIFPISISTLSEGQEVGLPCRFCGMALRRMIVPPVIGKRFQDVGKLAFLWNLALREMRTTQNLVMIGVSLAPTDFDLRWLIREGAGFHREHELQVDIINPNAGHRSEIINILPKSIIKHREFETIESYLNVAT